MTRPRILHLIHHLRVGGAEMMLTELLPRLRDAGFDVQCACLDERGPLFEILRQRGIRSHCIDRRRGFDPAATLRLARLLRTERIAILNTHSFSAGFWGRLAAILARTPRVVTTVHTVAGWSQPHKQRLGNRLLRPATDRVVAVSDCVRRSFLGQGLAPERIETIHNGICLQRFARAAEPVSQRRALGLPATGFLTGLIARCSPEKGGAVWLRAMAHILREGADLHSVLVGEGPALAAWKALAEAEGIGGRVHFVGSQTDVAPWLGVLDVLVCPSSQESFGLAALEAQAAGVPVVATRVDGFLEVLHDDVDALLVPVDDPTSLAAAVRSLLESPARAARLTEAGRHNAALFSIERTTDRYSALYRTLLA